jgi:OmcA/MtrC family decaheme c-type cytochrome
MTSRRTRPWQWIAAACVGLAALGGCGGGGDSGAAGPAGQTGPAGPTGPQGPAGPSGGTALNAAGLTPEQWAAAKFAAQVTSVTISSPPVVEFTVTDTLGNPVVGLERFTAKASNAQIANYPNFAFTLAKLVPRSDARPSSWVNYVVTSVSATSGAVTLTRPTTDNLGTMVAVDNKPGTYRYTFYRDIPGIKAQVDGITATAGQDKADLGDLTYQPTLPHRLVIQFGGAARGTGDNTANAVQTQPPVVMQNPLNVVYDFKPGPTGQPGMPIPESELTREDVNIDTCNVCHSKLAIHEFPRGQPVAARVEVKYCVVCHTTQRAFGQTKVTSTAGKFPALTETKTVNAATGITSYSYSPETRVADGEVAGDFTTMIHKIHQGKELVKENYNYANLVFDNKGFSKLGGGQRMCTTCHDGKVAQTADNHKNLPSRQACGACHDGINWATGGGSTLADKAATAYGAALATSGHGSASIGGPQADDSQCATCHTPQNIRIDHRMENLTKNSTYILPGLAVFTYEIDSASVNGSNALTIRFRILKQVADSTGSVTNVAKEPVTLAAAGAGTPAQVLAGFSGQPSFLLAYASTQDGITSPADFTNTGRKQAQPKSICLCDLLDTNKATTVGTLSARDPNGGWYTATIVSAAAFPTGSKMRTVALQGYFTQKSAPLTPQGATGDVARHAISVLKTVNGDTARRTVVSAEKCASCHEWFEGHGGNRVYETQVCAMCHVPGLATSGRGIADATLQAYFNNTAPNTPTASTGAFTLDEKKILSEWGFNATLPNAALKLPVTSNNFKDMIHGIHAGRDRVTPFQNARDRSPGAIVVLDFRRMDFPGILSNCETCHVTAVTTDQKTYNYVPSGALASVYESIDATYSAGILAGTATTAQAKTSLNTVNATDTVTTPFTAACVSCHDNQPARAHMAINGGAIGLARSVALPTSRPLEDVESCAVCHGPGREFDTAKVHK